MKKVILTALTALTLIACSKEEITPDSAATAVSDNSPITTEGVWHLKEKVIIIPDGERYKDNHTYKQVIS